MDRSGVIAHFAQAMPAAALRFVMRRDGRRTVHFLNARCRDIFGLPLHAPEPSPRTLADMIEPDDRPAMRRSIAQSADTLSPWECHFAITDGCGQRRHILGQGAPARLSTNDGIEWLTFLYDVTAQERTEARIAAVSDQLRMVSEAIPDGFAMFDAGERMIVCNRHFRALYGLDPETDIAGWSYETLLRHAVARRIFAESDGRDSAWIADRLALFRAADSMVEERIGAARWFRILDRPTAEGGRVAFRIETTRTRNREQDLELAALTDSLTGLWNRRGLSRHLRQSCAELRPGERIALLHMDLDKFKTVNDSAGHDAGDAVLIAVARRLSDRIDRRAAVARIGGDEFVIALPTAADDAALCAEAEALRRSVTEPVAFGNRRFAVGASVGVAVWQEGSGDGAIDQALLDADTALMKGKAFGRNRTVRFLPEMRVEAQRVASIAGAIKRDLAQGRFLPFFQPLVRLPCGRVEGAEALVRWRTADGEILPAGQFVPVAEETGLIGEIDRQMATAAFDTLQTITRERGRDFRLSLNLSVKQLRDPEAVDALLDLLCRRGLPAHRVTIEILESTLLDERCDAIAGSIDRLAWAGFRIALDDFGTGHTALASLRHFPVHRIKIDQSLVRAVDSEAATRAIVEGIAALCGSLNIEVVAEGVETTAELRTLQAIGITLVQGYVIAPPMAASDLCHWLSERDRNAG